MHFDNPINAKKAQNIACSPETVQSHSFYPFISYTNTTYKIYKDKEDKKLKSKDKSRPISYASHIDSAIYSYYSHLLSIEYEKQLKVHGLLNTVLAFRSLGKSNIDFAFEIFSEIKSKKFCSAIALDITGFFDNIDHSHLKNMWSYTLNCQVLPEDHYAVFKAITHYSKVDKDKLYAELGIAKNNPKNNRSRACTPKEFRERVRNKGLITKNKNSYGIPQGSPISAMLSNIYMMDFDKKIYNFVTEKRGSYYRYCDDMMIIIHPRYRDMSISFIAEEIEKVKLSINQNKTEIANFSISAGKQSSDRLLQYLGFTFDGERILLRSSALARFSGKMKRGIKLAKLTKEKYDKRRNLNGLPSKNLYKYKIYERYSHLGKQNFLTYGYRAAKKMDSRNIRKQLKPLWSRLITEIKK